MNYHFDQIARLPEPGDNAAIATRRLEAGTHIQYGKRLLTLDFTVLEGHRFTVQPIQAGEALLSWGLPFGFALRVILAGGYVINAAALETLRTRTIDFALPQAPNFEERTLNYTLDEASFQPAAAPPLADGSTFMGYARPGGRGAGTRNHIVLLGLSSYTNGYVRQLETRLQAAAGHMPNLDGVRAVAHTEGSQPDAGNLELVQRTLAGFAVHPNAAAVLLVEHPDTAGEAARLYAWMETHGYPLAETPHALLTLSGDFEADLQRGQALAESWLEMASAQKRTPLPLSMLKIALQCGGSDAFSGISGNPLVGWVAREVIRRGGSALLAETPELMGAETYVLQRVRDLQTARRFLEVVARFKADVGAYGVSVEGNVGGGNRTRGLYNITLKAVGAARKRHPEVRLDSVLDYAVRLAEGGYYFMDSPGNDLESIAGQIAAGCNLILFVTGNGSVTNFPFVPTLKVVTTTGRYNLMPHEMDVNAGRYLDGTPLEVLGEETLTLVQAAASGQRTAGELAGHAQVQLWRSAPRLEAPRKAVDQALPAVAGGKSLKDGSDIAFQLYKTPTGYAPEQVGLIVPASLCAAQAARLAAERLNAAGMGQAAGISRFVALMHTEGCGSSPNTDALVTRLLAGHVRSPLVRLALVLEHGCERLLNDVLQRTFAGLGIDPAQVGWASLQMDGGLEGALEKIERWFRERTAGLQPLTRTTAGLEAVRLGLLAQRAVSPPAARALGELAGVIATGGGTLVTALNFERLPVLAFAEAPQAPGLYRMQAPTAHWSELQAGLGAAGVNVMLGLAVDGALPGHPLVPLLQAAGGEVTGVDLRLVGDPAEWAGQMLERIVAVLEGRYVPLALRQGNVDFQLPRGERGVSL